MRINLRQTETAKKILSLHYKGCAITPLCFDSQFCPGPPKIAVPQRELRKLG
jgi:hypothetical protein